MKKGLALLFALVGASILAPFASGQSTGKPYVDYFSVRALGATPDMNSVKSMTEYMDRLDARIREAEALEKIGIKVPQIKRLNRTHEWYGAHLHYVKQRAFPGDSIDWTLFEKAIDYRKNMKSGRPEFDPSRVPARNLEPGDYPDSEWAYLGPNNADSPGGGGGPTPIAGRVSGIAISYQNPDSVWYVSGGNGGVFKSTDGGATWVDKTNGTWDHLYVGDIAVSPTNENLIIAGLGDYDDYQRWGQGIMRSTNGGSTWALIRPSTNFSSPISDIMFDPDDSTRIFLAAGRGGSDGLWLSEDSGLTWTRLIIDDMQGLTFSPGAGGLRKFYSAADNKIYRSTDNGDTWEDVSPVFMSMGQTTAVACSKANNNIVYAMVSEDQDIYKSTDSGDTWSLTSSNFVHGNASNATANWGQNTYDWVMETSRTSANADVIFVGLIDLVTSRNGGSSWQDTGGHMTTGATIHVDHHVMVNHPTNRDIMFCGSDGGFYRVIWNSTTSTYTVDNSYNDNLPIAMFYFLGAHPTNTSYFMGGLQDNGTTHSFGNTANWGTVGGADGTGAAIFQPNPVYQFRTVQRAGAGRSPDGTTDMEIKYTTNSWVSSGLAASNVQAGDSVIFVPPIVTTTEAGVPSAYIGSEWLYRLTFILGNTPLWIRHVGNFNFGSSITCIAVAPSNNDVLYVGTEEGALFRSGNLGANWTDISAQEAYPTCISVDPNNSNSVLVTFTGTNVSGGNVWRCLDTSAATPSWFSRSGLSGSSPLPQIWTNWIERDPWRPTTVWYVANDTGVYYTDDSGSTWHDMTYGFGMPNVSVRHLQIAPDANRLYAATYGRGLYRMILSDTRPIISEVGFTATEVVGGSFAALEITFSKVTPPDGVTVSLSYSPSAIVPNAPTSITVPGGRTNYFVGVPVNVVANDTLLVATATGQFGGQLAGLITVRSHEMTGFTISPTSVVGSHNATGTVFLNYAAPSSGIVVSLQTANSAVATVPSTVTVSSGTSSKAFTIQTYAQTSTSSADILASFSSTSLIRTITATFTNLSDHVIANTNITSGNLFSGTVSIQTAAGPQGVPINLTSNNANVQVPPVVLIQNGQTSATYLGNTTLFTGSTQSATITANRGSAFYPETISVQPVNVSTIVAPNKVARGEAFNVTVNLTRAAPSAGVTVNVTSSDPKVVRLTQGSVFIPAGQTSVTAKIGRAGNTSAKPVTLTANHLTSTKITTVTVTNDRP